MPILTLDSTSFTSLFRISLMHGFGRWGRATNENISIQTT